MTVRHALFRAWLADFASDVRSGVRALSPATVAWGVPGPIFHKEMRVAGRRKVTYVIRCLYAFALIALVGLVYLVNREGTVYASDAASLQRVQALAPAVAIAVAWFQMVGLPIVAIILASPQVCDERRAGTLASLLTTPLRAWQVVLGKFAVVGVNILVLALIATPVLLAIRLFGGVTPEFVLGMEALTISTAFLGAGLALMHSTGVKRASSAAAAAFVATAASQAWLPLVLLAVLVRNQNISPEYFGWGCAPVALGMLSVDLLEPSGIPVDVNGIWPIACVYNFCVAALACLGASFRVRAAMWRDGGAGSPAPRPAPAASTTRGWRARRGPCVGSNPVLWREARQPVFRSRLFAWLTSLGIAAGLSLLYWRVGWDDMDEPGIHFSIAVIGCALTLVLAVFGSAGEIASEREGRTLDVLLATPLTARAIIWGKFLGFLHRAWYVPAAVMAHFLIMVCTRIVHPAVLIVLPVAYFFPLTAVSATGVMFSAFVERTARAAAANLALWFCVYIVLPVVGGIAAIGMRGGDAEIVGIVLFPNAATMTVVGMTGLVRRWDDGGWEENFDYYGISDLDGVEFGFLLFFWAGLYAVVTWGALSLAAARLRVLTARRV